MKSYKVFSVDTANNLSLIENKIKTNAKANNNVIIQIILAYIYTPKLATRSTTQFKPITEEPFAFEAMEIVRSLTIGQQVQFEAIHYIKSLQQIQGRLLLQTNEDVAVLLLEKGFAKCDPKLVEFLLSLGTDHEMVIEISPEVAADYLKAEKLARSLKLGIWSNQDKTMHTRILPPPLTDLTMWTHCTEKARIEQIVDGITLYITILSTNDYLKVKLACVNINVSKNNKIETQAKMFTETRLLHRHLPITFYNIVDDYSLISIENNHKYYQEILLENKYVHYTQNCDDIQLNKRLNEAQDLVKFENKQKVVKANKNGKYLSDIKSTHIDSKKKIQKAPLVGQVIKIVSGDTLLVLLPDDNLVKVIIENIKCNKMNRKETHDKHQTQIIYANFAWEIRKHLIQSYIGREVQLNIFKTFNKNSNELYPIIRAHVLSSSGNSIAAELISMGLANYPSSDMGPMKNKSSDIHRELVAAHTNASTEKLGLYGDAPSNKIVIHEIHSLTNSKAKEILSFINPSGETNWVDATIENIMCTNIVTVYLPEISYQIVFKLDWVITPSMNADIDKSDPFANEAKLYMMKKYLQRPVKVSIESTDDRCNFSGKIKVDEHFISEDLLEMGFAVLSPQNQFSHNHRLKLAEEKARNAKKNIWSNPDYLPKLYKKLKKEPYSKFMALSNSKEENIPVLLTYVQSPTVIWVQHRSSSNILLYKQMKKLINQLIADTTNFNSPNSDIFICFDTKTDTWVRAKLQSEEVKSNSKEDIKSVFFIDFGYIQEVESEHICFIPENKEYNLLKHIPPMAECITLAYIQLDDMSTVNDQNRDQEPTELNKTNYPWYDDAISELYTFKEETLAASIAYKDDMNKPYYWVYCNSIALSEHLLGVGMVVIDPKFNGINQYYYNICVKAQCNAQKNKRYIWNSLYINELNN